MSHLLNIGFWIWLLSEQPSRLFASWREHRKGSVTAPAPERD